MLGAWERGNGGTAHVKNREGHPGGRGRRRARCIGLRPRRSPSGAVLPGESFLFPLLSPKSPVWGAHRPGSPPDRAAPSAGADLSGKFRVGRPRSPLRQGVTAPMNKRVGMGGIVLSLCGWAGAAGRRMSSGGPRPGRRSCNRPPIWWSCPPPAPRSAGRCRSQFLRPGFRLRPGSGGVSRSRAPTPLPRSADDPADDAEAAGLFAVDRTDAGAARRLSGRTYCRHAAARPRRDRRSAPHRQSCAGSGRADAGGAGRPVRGPGVLDAALLRPRRIPPVAVQEGPGPAAGDDQRAGRRRDPRPSDDADSCSAATACPTGRIRAAGSRPACGWTIARRRRSR